ncbi:MAG: hypothetical protein R2854_22945 [Caldilineaceae bacterium]
MAPDTSIGAASPVGGQGEDIGETMQAKVENILSADIENLADRRGDAATEWAIAAVREARPPPRTRRWTWASSTLWPTTWTTCSRR